jgi:hypothetical protein
LTISKLPHRGYWFSTALVALTIAFFWSLETLRTPNVFDAAGYVRIAEHMRTNGVFSNHELSDVRLYGYPAFLRWVLSFAQLTGVNDRLLGFALQLGLHFAASIGLAWSLSRCGVRGWAWRAAVAAVMAHPLALLYPGFFLTESLAFSLGTTLLALAIAAWERRGGAVVWIAGGLVCGAMIVVRPASVFVLPVWVLVAARGLIRREWLAALGLAAVLLPLAPQWWMNRTYHSQSTPLVASSIARGLQVMGILNSKYATAMIPGMEPPILYANPFLVDEPLARQDPVVWYQTHPAAGLATWALHLFNTLDQDLPLPFVRDLAPAYGPWVVAANWAMTGLGLASLLAAWRRGGTAGERGAIRISTGLIVGHLGGYGLSLVESRYGVAALVPLYAWAAVGGSWLARSGAPLQRWAAGVLMVGVGAAGMAVSGWVREYSPLIQDAMGREPRRPASGKAKHPLCVSAWSDWTVSGTRVGPSGELVISAGGDAAHPVDTAPETVYWLDFEVTGKAVERSRGDIVIEGTGGGYQWVRFAQKGGGRREIRFSATSLARLRNVRFGVAEAMPLAADWQRLNVLVQLDGAAVFCSENGAVGLLSRPVTLEKNTEYEVEFEIRSHGPGTGEMSIDLFGPGYDAAEQNGFVREYPTEFERKRIRWNSGPSAPPRAELRFVTLSDVPITVRDIQFRKAP